MKRFILTSVAAALALSSFAGCKDDDHSHTGPAAQSGGATAPQAKVDDHGHPHADPAAPKKEDHANAVPLGTKTVGNLTLAATQDEPIKAGGEGAFDLKVTGYPAGGKPKAVRFWVGVESGEASAKALAAEETPDNWHTHAEVPNPIPAGSKFWAEVEPASGEKFKVSFDLKQ